MRTLKTITLRKLLLINSMNKIIVKYADAIRNYDQNTVIVVVNVLGNLIITVLGLEPVWVKIIIVNLYLCLLRRLFKLLSASIL